MISLTFTFGVDTVEVSIVNKQIFFATSHGGMVQFAPLEGLQFSYAGILKEFPDLKDVPEKEAREIALKRLKDKINAMKSEEDIADYIIEDLKQQGYVLKSRNKIKDIKALRKNGCGYIG